MTSALQRVVTAMIAAPLFIWAVFSMPSDYFSYLLLFLVALGSLEFSKLIKLRSPYSRITYSVFIITVALFVNSLENAVPFVLSLSLIWWAINLYWVVSYPSKTSLWFDPFVVRVLSGLMLLIPMWISLSYLHRVYGPEWFLLLMLIVWAADSGAYFTGKSIGKHKLSPNVSPGKTIEGLLGGVVFSIAALILFVTLSEEGQKIDTPEYVGYFFLVIIIGLVSVLGDLYESLFKRVSNIKDSGKFFPGHGGILDRVDSLTAASPFFLVGLNLL